MLAPGVGGVGVRERAFADGGGVVAFFEGGGRDVGVHDWD